MKRSRFNEGGFTLIELLVTVGIIGVLAALIFAVLSSAKNTARRIQCANNVRQIEMGMQQSVDAEHVYPLAWQWKRSAVKDGLGVPTFTSNSYEPPGILRCPSCVIRVVKIPNTRGVLVNNNDYGYNALGLTARWLDGLAPNLLGLGGHTSIAMSSPPSQAVGESEVLSPSSMIAFADEFSGNKGVLLDYGRILSRNWNWGDQYPYIDYAAVTKILYAKHQGKANVVFCDGHVQALTLKKLVEDTDDAALSLWNRDHQPHREALNP